jgi:Flp pilus assembly protein TadG
VAQPRPPKLAFLRKLRRRGAGESGVVLVLVAVMMVAFLGMAALAIDVGSFYQAQRQAQSAADAGALAAGQDLPGSSTSATSDGTTYATTNDPGATATVTTPYAGSSSVVKVTVNTTTPSFFGHIFGLTHANVSASAVVGETQLPACSSPGTGCYGIFAMDSGCGSNGVTFNGAGNTVTGGVHSNGSIDLIGGTQSLGPTTYGNGTGCAVTQGGKGDTFKSGPTAQAPITQWPDDYSQVLTACGGAGAVACTGPNGTPSYCTQAQANFNFPTDPIATGNVYCAYGTTGTPSTPSTWTGLISFTSGTFGTASVPIQGTWIGGTIEVGRQSFLTTQTTTPSYPVFYATGSGNCSTASSGGVCMTAAGSGVNGAMFAPAGTIEFNGSGSTSNFLESQDVNLVGGNFTGNGPSDAGTTTSSSTESLLQ